MHSINGIDWNDIQNDRRTNKSEWTSAVNNWYSFFGIKQLIVSPSYRNLGETQSLGQSGISGDSL